MYDWFNLIATTDLIANITQFIEMNLTIAQIVIVAVKIL
jgi:hypothetical protein